ncbi:MAG TPA: ABC transporter ATP-binding protein [Thermoanaerobaculia bacterium]|nr:ABC transporter ATP-binding protein [Thermoanaerobaculia bacterium]
MTTSAIVVESLGKEYAVGVAERQNTTFYDVVSDWVRAPLERIRKFAGRVEEADRFWALRDVSFDVAEGEAIGVIGRNGAGKSTLLKILSRITAPTVGRATIRGRLASLLEVGTGFHPELTGRENIYLNGAIMGMTRREVIEKFDEIVAFAGVEQFIDTPVKRYSSGMYVRLAFAVAAHLEADVLVVDEVLAVGDAAFQRKSLSKMSDVAKRGRTVLLVSHNLGAIRNLCTRTLVFESGTLRFAGDVTEGLALYERSFASAGAGFEHTQFRGPLAEHVRFDSLVFRQADKIVDIVDPLLPATIELRGHATQTFPTVDLKIGLFRDGVFVASCHDTPAEARMSEGEFTSRFEFAADVFRPGRYMIGMGAVAAVGTWVWGQDVVAFDVSENRGGRSADRSEGLIGLPYRSERVQ